MDVAGVTEKARAEGERTKARRLTCSALTSLHLIYTICLTTFVSVFGSSSFYLHLSCIIVLKSNNFPQGTIPVQTLSCDVLYCQCLIQICSLVATIILLPPSAKCLHSRHSFCLDFISAQPLSDWAPTKRLNLPASNNNLVLPFATGRLPSICHLLLFGICEGWQKLCHPRSVLLHYCTLLSSRVSSEVHYPFPESRFRTSRVPYNESLSRVGPTTADGHRRRGC